MSNEIRDFVIACPERTDIPKYREYVLELTGGQCAICGYNKCLNAITFHHVIPLKMEGHHKQGRVWSDVRIDYEPEKLWNDLTGIITLCSNCHKEVHAGVTLVTSRHLKSNPYFDFKRIPEEVKSDDKES